MEPITFVTTKAMVMNGQEQPKGEPIAVLAMRPGCTLDRLVAGIHAGHIVAAAPDAPGSSTIAPEVTTPAAPELSTRNDGE